ncbi:MAG: DNA polymerase III subunit beta [Syntrophales bacterium]|nr:DNA polymerase III subunit beta [Syntrophales bacterium]
MEFSTTKEVLRVAVQRTLGIADKKTTIPILSYILLKTEGEKLKIVATDREISLISRYVVSAKKEGSILVPARKFFEMIRELPDDEIWCHVEENGQVKLKAGRVTYRLMGLKESEFPNILEVEDLTLYPIRVAVLLGLIKKTVFSASTDDLRPSMNGVFFEVEESVNGMRLKMVATDGHRMAIACSDPEEHGGMTLAKGAIIPRRGIMEIRRLLEDLNGSDMINMGFDKGMVVLKTEEVTMKVGLIDSEFPDYKRVIPSDKGIPIRLEREQLLRTLKRMSVMSSDRYTGVVLNLHDNMMVFSSVNPDVGEASEELEVEYEGEEVRVGYNVRYLVDAVEVVEEEGVLFEVRTGFRPGVIRCVGSDHYASYIMPLRI